MFNVILRIFGLMFRSKLFVWIAILLIFICYMFLYYHMLSTRSNDRFFKVISRKSQSKSIIWIENMKAQVIYYNKYYFNSFQNLGISNITSNISLLSTIDPFSLSSGINVWDLYPPMITCPDLQRIGRVGDGGKWLCGITYISTLSSCIVYSFGISTDASFEEELLKHSNCIIYAFDPSVGELPKSYLTNTTLWGEHIYKERVIFHKIAIDTSTGSNALHSLTESIYDIMHRFNHRYIDLLKIDIEGAEWKFFENLFQSKKLSILPFGQIVIELHYKDMITTNNFFTNINKFGFYSYSREINLQPCLVGNKPTAVEYSFININNIMTAQLNFNNFPVPKPLNAIWHKPINGVVYILTKKDRFDLLKYILSQYYIYVYRPYPFYPLIIFHEDLESYHIIKLRQEMPNLSIVFIKLSFQMPSFLNKETIPEYTECSPKSSTIGYRHMCRFHSFIVYDYLNSLKFNELTKFSYNYLSTNSIDISYTNIDLTSYSNGNHGNSDIDYIVRIDDDSLFTSYIGYDIFRYMQTNKKLYGFVNIVSDDTKCVKNLWNKTNNFLSTHPLINTSEGFYNEWKEPNVFYNNFEVSHLSIWNNPIYRSYIQYIDKLGGIYYHRWGDAPIHTIGISLFLSKQYIHSFSDIGYQHNPFINQISSGLPIPNVDPFIPSNTLHCNFYSHWTCTTGNNTNNVTINSKIDKIQYEHESIVLYSFGHSSREVILAKSIYSFYTNYASRYYIPFVIFYSINTFPLFNESIVDYTLSKLYQISSNSSLSIKYIGVPLKSIPSGDRDCTSMNPEVRGASYFLRYQYIQYLSQYNYTWFIRFADSSELKYPVTYDIINRMIINRKKYGFISAVREHSKCVSNYWNHTKSFCESKKVDKCSSLLQSWPEHVVYFNNFEVSHVSVWNNPLCQELQQKFTMTDKVAKYEDNALDLTQQMTNNNTMDKYVDNSLTQGDAVVHTMCVIISLSTNEVIRLDDIDYIVHFTADINTSKQNTVKEYSLKILATDKFIMTPIVELDKLFYPRKFGWLGGDVGASIRLPHYGNNITRYLWLFGDSVVGTSNSIRRIDGKIVANTIALSTHIDNNIQSLKFYWGESLDGSQSPFFQLTKQNNPLLEGSSLSNIYDKDALFWPLGGISIMPSDKSLGKIFIIGQFVIPNQEESLTPILTDQTRALEFEELSSTIVIIDNSYDSIDMWSYKHILFPDVSIGSFKWFAMADSNNKSFITNVNDYVYIIGSYSPILTSNLKFDFFDVSTSKSYQVISRIKTLDLLSYDLKKLEILTFKSTDSNTDNKWTLLYELEDDEIKPKPLFSPRITECSFHYLNGLNQWLVVSLQIPQTYVQLCLSPDIIGPWTCQLVMSPPNPWNNTNIYVTYAAKYHPELSNVESNEYIDIVISLVPNTIKGFSVLFDEIHHQAYSPKFYRIQQKK